MLELRLLQLQGDAGAHDPKAKLVELPAAEVVVQLLLDLRKLSVPVPPTDAAHRQP
jgi:hypothetical protein